MADDQDAASPLTPAFIVEKFFPPRCPSCYREFRRPSDDFVPYAGNEGGSYIEARFWQRERFPEIFGQKVSGMDRDAGPPPGTSRNSLVHLGDVDGSVEALDRTGANLAVDFILCRGCQNIKGERTSTTQEASWTVFLDRRGNRSARMSGSSC